jgi:elongation factor Ts
MAEITPELVRTLRDKTNAGMMDCKKALAETQGDLEAAETLLRKKGILKAGSKADRATKEGVVHAFLGGSAGVLIEVNCETDFVAKNDNFKAFVSELAQKLAAGAASDGEEVTTLIKSKIAEMGENIVLRRVEKMDSAGSVLQAYIHLGGRVGVLLQATAPDTDAARGVLKDVCMHIAASSPRFLSRDQVDPAFIAREREIAAEQVKDKPANIVDKIVSGKIDKIVAETCLLDQAFIKNPDISVNDHIKSGGDTKLTRFVRYAVGEEL